MYNVFNVTDPNILYDDPCVIEFEVWNPPQLLARYQSGFLQSRANYLEFDGKYLVVPRTLHKKGLTGKGQIVSVLDSGIDSNHDFFYDPNYPEIGLLENPEHRKIYKIASTYNQDQKDKEGGHGTHVCGILAGKSLQEDSATGQYNGVAPDAKIHMTDLAPSGDDEDDHLWGVGFINLPVTFHSFLLHDIGISSNSWGSPYTHMVNYEFDRIGYESDDLLVVAGAGNSGSEPFSILSPATSKNVLTVANTYQPGIASVEDNKYRSLTIILDDDSVVTDAYQAANSRDLIELYSPVSSLENIPNNPNGGYTVINNYLDDFCDVRDEAINNGAEMFIFGGTEECPNRAPPKKIALIRTKLTYSAYRIRDAKYIKKIYLNSSVNNEMTYAPETSTGPAYNFGIKPDISAPGNLITSAKSGGTKYTYDPTATNRDNLVTYSGTSMSTPAISGAAALLRQFFIDKGYNGTEIKPKSSLLRSALINSAIRCSGDKNEYHQSVRTGFGVPYLEPAVGMSDNGIFYINNERILSDGHHMYIITTTETMDLTVTLSYVDKPIDNEAYLMYAFIHIFIEDSNGKTYMENQRSDNTDDYGTTNKKVIISNASPGEYKLHIYANDYDPTNVDEIHYSLSVFGGFDTNDKNAVIGKPPTCPITCNNKCDSVMRCICDDNHVGTLCSSEARDIELNTSTESNVDVYTTSFFRYAAKSGQKFILNSDPGRMIMLCTHIGKLNTPDRQCFYGYRPYLFNVKVTEDTNLYISLNALSSTKSPISITLSEDLTQEPTPHPEPVPEPETPPSTETETETETETTDQNALPHPFSSSSSEQEANTDGQEEPNQNEGSNQKVTIGVSISVVVVIIIIIAVTAFLLIKRKRAMKETKSVSEEEYSTTTNNGVNNGCNDITGV